MIYECGRCGGRVEDELVEKYKDGGIEEPMFWCRSCVEDVPVAIQDLFDQMADSLSDENAEKFRDQSVSDRALFAMQLIEDGMISGGTVGHLETLRILMCTGLEVEE